MVKDEVNRGAVFFQEEEPVPARAKLATESGHRGKPTSTPGLGPRSQLRQERTPGPESSVFSL